MKCIEDEIPFEVPEGWEWDRLSNIASFSGGKTPSTSKHEFWNGDVLWVTSKDMKSKYIESSQLMLSNEGALQMQLYPAGTVLMVARSGILRHTLPIAILKKEATINQDIKAISLLNCELSEWLYTCLKGMEQTILLKYTKSGTTVENINFDEFKNILLPVPSEKEINHIIMQVQNAIDKVDVVENTKKDLCELMDYTKSKILDLAIRGKLLEQNPDDEPASVLLERIRAEKEELINQGKLKRDNKESIIYKGDDNSYYQTGSSEPIEVPYEIPETWAWSNLKELCNYGVCDNIPPEVIDSDAWILDLEDIEKDTGRIVYRATNAERKTTSTKHSFHKDMILYSKLRPYLNKVVLADADGYCTSEIIPLSFSEIILPRYAQLFLMSPFFVGYANHCSYGMKMPRLGTHDGERALFAIPPYQEQARIVDMVDKLHANIDKIQESLTM